MPSVDYKQFNDIFVPVGMAMFASGYVSVRQWVHSLPVDTL